MDHVSQIKSLSDIARIVSSARDPQDMLDRLAFAVCCNSPWQSSSIMAIDRAEGNSVQVASFNRHIPESSAPYIWKLSHSPTAEVLDHGQPVIIPDALNDRTYIDYWTEAQLQRFRTVVLLPLRVSDGAGRPMILSLHASQRLNLTEDDLTFLSALADLAGVAVEKGLRLEAQHVINDQLERLLRLQRKLILEALQESSLDSIVHLGTQFLDCPFIVLDMTEARVLCGGLQGDEDLAEGDFSKYLQSQGWQKVMHLFRDCEPSRFNRISRLVIPWRGKQVALSLAAEPVIIRKQKIGGIALLREAPLDDLSTYTAESLWMALSIVLLRNHIRIQSDTETISTQISELLQGKAGASEEHRLSGEMCLLLDGPHRILAINPRSEDVTHTACRWALTKIAESSGGKVMFGVVGELFVLVIPERERTDDLISEVADRAIDELRRINGFRPIVAESPTCRTLADYAPTWRKMVRVLRWARDAGTEGHVTIPDAGALGLLGDVMDYRLTREFVDRALGPIRDYDARHQTQLLPTLESLVKNGSRPQPSAVDTGVHITTVRYRMDRLRDLFGLDLRDSDTRFRLDLALRLDRLFTAETGNEPRILGSKHRGGTETCEKADEPRQVN